MSHVVRKHFYHCLDTMVKGVAIFDWKSNYSFPDELHFLWWLKKHRNFYLGPAEKRIGFYSENSEI